MKDWKLVSLRDVCTLINGRAYKQAELLNEGKYPVLRVGNFFSNRSWYYSDLELDDNKYCDDGDLLYAWSASFGPRIWQGGKVIYHYHIWKTDIDSNKVYKKFLYHWFEWDTEKIKATQGVGTTMIHVTKGAMEERSLFLPPLSEQKRIVSIVDEAFEAIDIAIDNTKQNLANARELFDSYLNAIFTEKGDGWVDKVIEDHVKFIDYRGRTPDKTEKGMRLITAKNVKMGFLQKEPQEFVDPDIYDTWMTRGIPRKYDVLFTTEAPMGNVAQLDTDEKVAFAQRIIIMQPHPKFIDSTFLKFLLLSNVVQNRIKDKGTGATVQGIKASLLKKIVISYPSEIINQKAIVLKLDALRTETKRLEAIYCQKLAALNELKQSILHKAFTGELTADTADLKTNIEKEAIAV